MDTKLNPRRMGQYQYSHKKEDLERGLLDSLQALNTDKVDLFYLHAPDVSTFFRLAQLHTWTNVV